MILRFLCPSGHVLDVDARLAGRKIRCGGCGKIMVVPMPRGTHVLVGRGPVKRPPAQRTPGKAPAKSIPRPPAEPIAKPQAAPAAKPPTQEPRPPLPVSGFQLPPPFFPPPAPSFPLPAPCSLPPATPPSLPREEGMVALPLPPVEQPERAATAHPSSLIPHPSSFVLHPLSWLRKRWPAAERHLPADVTIPGTAERRIALQLAAVPAVVALVSLLPVGLGHANLLRAPPWALAAVFLAVLQLAYAAWMINVPDWATARVQTLRLRHSGNHLRHADDLDDDHSGQPFADSRP